MEKKFALLPLQMVFFQYCPVMNSNSQKRDLSCSVSLTVYAVVHASYFLFMFFYVLRVRVS